MTLTHEESFALERIRDLVRETSATIDQIGRSLRSHKLEEITTSLSDIETSTTEWLLEHPVEEFHDLRPEYDDFPNNLMLTDIEYDF